MRHFIWMMKQHVCCIVVVVVDRGMAHLRDVMKNPENPKDPCDD
jgi:hypothetical protein